MNNEIDGTEIHIDKEKNRLYVKTGGFVKKEESVETFKEIIKKASQLEENASALMDLRGFTVAQNHEILQGDLSNIMPNVKFVANVMGSSPVGKLQVSRFVDKKNENMEVKFFDDVDEATKWLDLKQG